VTNQPAGLVEDRGGATTKASGATDQRLIGPGGYALALVCCFSISSLLPTHVHDDGPRELRPYPGCAVWVVRTVYPRTPGSLTDTRCDCQARRCGATAPPARACATPVPGQGLPPDTHPASGGSHTGTLDRGRARQRAQTCGAAAGNGPKERPELCCSFKSRPRLRRGSPYAPRSRRRLRSPELPACNSSGRS
jgi:hypothetical protein